MAFRHKPNPKFWFGYYSRGIEFWVPNPRSITQVPRQKLYNPITCMGRNVLGHTSLVTQRLLWDLVANVSRIPKSVNTVYILGNEALSERLLSNFLIQFHFGWVTWTVHNWFLHQSSQKGFQYTNSLVNADSFYSNFTNKTFQKIPIPSRSMSQKFLHWRKFFFSFYQLVPLNLLNMIFGKHN